MDYEDNMMLPKHMIYRLRGLRNGKFMTNKQPPNASYSYEVILLTFKACKLDILRYTTHGHFKDEQHRLNYIMVIIENNINDIVLRIQNSKQQVERVEAIDTSGIEREMKTEYKKKTKEKKNSTLDDLW